MNGEVKVDDIHLAGPDHSDRRPMSVRAATHFAVKNPAEQLPAFALEAHQLQLLDGREVGRTNGR